MVVCLMMTTGYSLPTFSTDTGDWLIYRFLINPSVHKMMKIVKNADPNFSLCLLCLFN